MSDGGMAGLIYIVGMIAIVWITISALRRSR